MIKDLENTFFLDYNNDIVKEFIQENINNNSTEVEKAISLFYAVRDKILYDPYQIILEPESLKASSVIKRKYGYCVEKAAVLTACLRGAGIKAKIGFANVKNHLTTYKLKNLMKSDVFAYHGYTAIFLNNKWIKVTPAFNLSLCKRAKIKPLDFDGDNNSLFHEFDNLGRKHMEYLQDFGTFDDIPFEKIIDIYEEYYPHLNVRKEKSFGSLNKVNFENEEIITE
ncbi:MAG: transglutaminase domain-containing protein [Leptospiraceae bacterium]|nr:transglutaminase domain-containing protein [Leptospiraceae bacterium]